MTKIEKKLKAINPYKSGVTGHDIIAGLCSILLTLDRRVTDLETAAGGRKSRKRK